MRLRFGGPLSGMDFLGCEAPVIAGENVETHGERFFQKLEDKRCKLTRRPAIQDNAVRGRIFHDSEVFHLVFFFFQHSQGR